MALIPVKVGDRFALVDNGECEDAPITEIKTAKANGKSRVKVIMPEGAA